MPKKSRDDYRCMTTGQLQEELRYVVSPDWQELAIALAERLKDREGRGEQDG